MLKYVLFCTVLLASTALSGQELSGEQLLDKAITFHDPNGNWSDFKGQMQITMTTPDNEQRLSHIKFDLPKQFFELSATSKGNTVLMSLDKGNCTLFLNGNSEISEADLKTHRLTCDRANTMKNYYTYLYGLPMKLKDAGTKIDPKVQRKKFKGKEYLVLKATYDITVGEDVWYFYFDPKTYAMEVYQFYHDESKNDGEYILLTGTETLLRIKFPKNRAWYYNIDDKYLATDVLTKISPL